MRIAFVCIGAAGHIVPSLGLCREFARRGHDTLFLLPEHDPGMAANSGGRVALFPSTTLAGGAPAYLDGFDMPGIPLSVAAELRASLPAITSEVRAFRADAVIYDAFTFAGFAVARQLGLLAIRMNFSYVLSSSSNYFELTERGLLRGRLSSPESIAAFEQQAGDLLRTCNVETKGFFELVAHRPDLDLVPMPAAFHPSASEPRLSQARFCGPMLGSTPRSEPPQSSMDTDLSETEPLVYISFGTVFCRRPGPYLHAIDALASRGMRLVVACGDAVPETLRANVPASVRVHSWINQPAVLASTSVFVTHGGMGGVMEALAAGVPMVVIPHFPEQLITARRVGELGLGLSLEPEDVSISSLRRAVDEALNGGTYAQRARDFSRLPEFTGGPSRAADLVLSLIAERRPR